MIQSIFSTEKSISKIFLFMHKKKNLNGPAIAFQRQNIHTIS